MTGEEVGKENASWVDSAIFRRALAVAEPDENRFESQPIVETGSSGGVLEAENRKCAVDVLNCVVQNVGSQHCGE